MVSTDAFLKIVRDFPGVIEKPHFEKISFRVKNKIFVTYSPEENNLVCIKLNEVSQSVYCAYDSEAMFPVNNLWGKKGWTYINLSKIEEEIFRDALTESYEILLGKKQKK